MRLIFAYKEFCRAERDRSETCTSKLLVQFCARATSRSLLSKSTELKRDAHIHKNSCVRLCEV